jgi:hypothetical protein
LGDAKDNTGLQAFRLLQELYMEAQEFGGAVRIREHVLELDPFDVDVDVEAVLSVAGSRVGNSEALAKSLFPVVSAKMQNSISAGVAAAEPASALSGFRAVWRMATGCCDEEDENEPAPESDFEVALSGAVASSDVAETGRLLVSRDVNKTLIETRKVAAKLLRKPEFGCPVLDVAVGSGAVDVAKFLFEFLGAMPTRETLKMALSSGNFELVRICWERLPELERKRLALLEVAGDFHQLEILAWLFRDADRFEKELFVGFAIRRHLADALLAVLVDGFRPWWAVRAAAEWAPMREFVFGPAPEGFWPDGGWFTNSKGKTKGIRAVNGRWTRKLARSGLGNESEVTDVMLPCGVEAIAGDAFRDYATLRSLTIQSGCVTIEDGKGRRSRNERYEGAMAECRSLVWATIPATCATIGSSAFGNCSGLTHLVVPSSVTTIGSSAFSGCSRLTELEIPPSVTTIGHDAFRNCSGLTKLVIPPSVTAIGYEAFSGCSGLTELEIPPSVTTIGHGAFRNCWGLTKLVIPPSVTAIGYEAFSGCWGLTELVVPSGVTTIERSAFFSCSGLTELVIPSGVTAIGDDAFAFCSGLTELVLPPSLTTIGDGAFSGCSRLRRLTISASLARFADYGAFRISIWDGLAGVRCDVFRGLELDRLTLVGSPLDRGLVANLERALAPGARVIGAALAGQAFGRFAIVAA